MRTLSPNDFGVLEFNGPEARKFLHSQLATDLRKHPVGAAPLAALLGANGRVLAAGTLLVQTEERFLWLLERGLLDSISAHLKRYVLRSKLKIQTRDDLHLRCGAAPDPAHPTFTDAAGRSLAVLERADLLHAAEARQFAAMAIHAGALDFAAEHSDHHLPQALGLHRIGAIALDKGCYPGQEIVARMHYLGRAKRALARFSSDEKPEGAELQDASGKRLGEILNLLELEGRWVGLASIQADADATSSSARSGATTIEFHVVD